MEGTHYVRAIARSWWLVLLTLLAGGAGGYAVYATTTPLYRSSVQLIVSGANGRQTDELSARILAIQRAFALSTVAPTVPAVQAASLAAGYPHAGVSVTAASDEDAPFLTIKVEGTSPRQVKAIADAYSRTLVPTMARLEGSTADENITVAELAPASSPGAPFQPRMNRDVGLGVAIGVVLGLALALVRDSVDHAVRSSDELQQLTGLTLLGSVPRDTPRQLLPALSNPRGARVEAYRQVRTTLLHSQARAIAVTSAAMGEGKTSVAANVAAVFARAGHRVALIDADLRRPRVAAFFGLRAEIGLADVLAGTATLAEALVMEQDGRLAVLPCARLPADPSEALDSPTMVQVLAQLLAEYEYVFVDTPPVLPVTDALVVAPKMDGVVLVARIGTTTRLQLRHAMNGLRRVNATVLGVVANQTGKGSDSDYRYAYDYTGRRRSDAGESRPTVVPR